MTVDLSFFRKLEKRHPLSFFCLDSKNCRNPFK